MFNKNWLAIIMLGFLFTFVSSINAQEKPTEGKDSKMTMQNEDMQKCMDKIAADSTMRMQMMAKMMDQCKGDSQSKSKMCQMIKTMKCKCMKECGMMEHKMKCDSTKTNDQATPDSHNDKK
jgi:hypothetical protein